MAASKTSALDTINPQIDTTFHWSKVSCITGGVIDSIASSPDGSVVFASADALDNKSFGAMYKTTNGGENWSEVKKGLAKPISLTNVMVNTISVVDNKIAYAGTLENGVFKTTDGGESWLQINTGLGHTGLTDTDINSIYAVDAQTVYVGTPSGLFKGVEK